MSTPAPTECTHAGIRPANISSRRRSRIDCQRSSGRFSRHVITTRSSDAGQDCLHTGDRLRSVLEDRANEARLAAALESATAGQHLVEDGAEREHVGAGVGLLAFELLGRHVLQRSEDGALLRENCWRGRQHRRASACEERLIVFASPKSSSFAPPDVSMMFEGFEIAMNDARLVGLVERVGNLDRMAQRAIQRQRPFASVAASVSPSRYCMTR